MGNHTPWSNFSSLSRLILMRLRNSSWSGGFWRIIATHLGSAPCMWSDCLRRCFRRILDKLWQCFRKMLGELRRFILTSTRFTRRFWGIISRRWNPPSCWCLRKFWGVISWTWNPSSRWCLQRIIVLLLGVVYVGDRKAVVVIQE